MVFNDNSSVRDLSTFKKAIEGMIAKNGRSWNELDGRYIRTQKIKNYTPEEIQEIINSGNLASQIRLSRNYFRKDGIYKRLILYLSTLLKYEGILIPNPSYGNKLSTSYIEKRYYGALDYLDKINVKQRCEYFSRIALTEGCYYGVRQEISKNEFILLDLPGEYSRSNFKDFYGRDIIEFNVLFFNSIYGEKNKKKALKTYPKVISDYYNRYIHGKETNEWMRVPSDLGFCFPITEDGRPLFLDVIPAILKYDEAVELDHERELEEIRKIIVQKIPHLNDGVLLFEPDEAEVMHGGAVDMMKGNKNISVLTTYADVEGIVSKTSSEAVTNTLEKNLQNVYSKANISAQIFAPTGSQALSTSIQKDSGLMMTMANKYAYFITCVINELFGNSNVNFTFKILPINQFNTSDYITDTFKLAQSGYSFLLPAIAAGLSQKDFINIKQMENGILGLRDLLLPLESAYTQSGEAGAPEKKLDDKSPKTLKNEEAINKQ